MKPIKYEALVRMADQSNNLMAPMEFLPLSQKLKLYPQITRKVIEESFRYFSSNGLNLGINLAFEDILNNQTKEFLFRKMDEYQISNRLTIEILESQELLYEKEIASFIKEVYKAGGKIAIDDFGSGFANFKFLTKIQADFIKIDGYLIRDLRSNKNLYSIVETIVEFAHKLGKKTVAEYVETKEILEAVKSLGIDYAQGYHLAKPSATVLTK
jgi:EAL domain-containing protein (putative c-di-GMP-specific phosphodiesterase class I)